MGCRGTTPTPPCRFELTGARPGCPRRPGTVCATRGGARRAGAYEVLEVSSAMDIVLATGHSPSTRFFAS